MNTRTTAFALLLLLSFTAAAAPNYSGTWRLDKDASKDLPQRFRDGVTDWSLTIAQSDASLTVDVQITGNGTSAPDMKNHFVYKLDGSDSPVELTIRTPDGPQKVAAISRAKVLENGEIDLTTTGETAVMDNVVKLETSERWKLDGDVLRIHRTDNTPRGTMTYELAFRRRSDG